MKPVDLDIIIVSYNTREVTLACLKSLLPALENLAAQMIVIDNASEDGTVQAIRDQHPEVVVIANRSNRGFAAANNQGLARARGRYQLLLNSDTEVHRDTLRTVVDYADAHPEVGILGCRSYGRDGKQQLTMFREPRLADLAINVAVPRSLMMRSPRLGRARYVGCDLDQEHDVEVVTGCFMLARQEMIRQIGGLDEDFFMYGEEVEWCHRARAAGWQVRYVPHASILHYGGVSTERCASQMSQAMARSQVMLFQKTRGTGTAWAANALMLLRDLPRATAWAVLRLKRWPEDSTFARGMQRSARRAALHAQGLVRRDWRPRPTTGRPSLGAAST
jgi:GT2 family glycosyltransferase